MDILHGIETKALALRQAPPAGDIMRIAQPGAAIELVMERPLFTPALKPLIAEIDLQAGDSDADPAALYTQTVVDKARLARHIRQALQARAQIMLHELIDTQPLQQGLAELVTYLQLGSESFKAVVDENAEDLITWEAASSDGVIVSKQARLPRVIFVR